MNAGTHMQPFEQLYSRYTIWPVIPQFASPERLPCSNYFQQTLSNAQNYKTSKLDSDDNI